MGMMEDPWAPPFFLLAAYMHLTLINLCTPNFAIPAIFHAQFAYPFKCYLIIIHSFTLRGLLLSNGFQT